MHEQTLRAEFRHQSETFNRVPTMTSAETLGTLLELVGAGGRWLDAACGPGLIARAIAPRVDAVHGVDLTPEMIAVARREAAGADLANTTFAVGDATALALPDGAFDGAVTRFSLHHVPVPARVVDELARVVRPGGRVVIADHVTEEDGVAAAWHEEIERLRDPSHWACLTPARLRALGERAGLVLEHERVVPFAVDYEEWLSRGSGGAAARALVERALRERPGGSPSFRVAGEDGRSWLHLRLWLSSWRRPGPG